MISRIMIPLFGFVHIKKTWLCWSNAWELYVILYFTAGSDIEPLRLGRSAGCARSLGERCSAMELLTRVAQIVWDATDTDADDCSSWHTALKIQNDLGSRCCVQDGHNHSRGCPRVKMGFLEVDCSRPVKTSEVLWLCCRKLRVKKKNSLCRSRSISPFSYVFDLKNQQICTVQEQTRPKHVCQQESQTCMPCISSSSGVRALLLAIFLLSITRYASLPAHLQEL